MLEGKNFLVTGGCGFIGSHLVNALDANGANIFVLDDLSTGDKNNLLGCSDRVRLIESSVENYELQSLPFISGVFHLAAQVSAPISVNNFFESSSLNLLSTLKMIDYCKGAKVPLIYASSSAVYGNISLGDEKGAINLLSPYAADKFMAEVYTRVANSLYGLSSFGFRFFNVYGPRQNPKNSYSGVISIFINNLLTGLDININGGYQTRDFVYVADVVKCLLKGYVHLNMNAGSFVTNVSTGHSVTINNLSKMIEEIVGKKVGRNVKDLPPGDPEISLGSVVEMEKLLNLKSTDFVKLQEGLINTVQWMKQQA